MVSELGNRFKGYFVLWIRILLLFGLLGFMWFISLNWINDLLIESTFVLTRLEQRSLVFGFKLFILSELMLSIACFRAFGNFRLFSSSSFFSFSFPLFSSYSFPLPFSNLLIPLYSSLALNGSQLFPKIGFLINFIEQLSMSLCCGFTFICPPFKYFFLIFSAFFFNASITIIEVFTGFYSSYSLYHIHYFSSFQLIIFFFFFIFFSFLLFIASIFLLFRQLY